MANIAKRSMRTVKNVTKGYSDIQVKVREATSNDAWGPSGTLMAEIAQATYNHYEFLEVMEMLDKRLNDKGKNWRHVFKALTVLDYCIHSGSEHVVRYARENLYIIKTLREFQHLDEDGRDQGQNVRQKAKALTALLADEERLAAERSNREYMHERMDDGYYPARRGSAPGDIERPSRTAAGPGGEDSEMRRAIEESKRTAAEEMKLNRSSEEDLRRAIELSQQEANEYERNVTTSNELILSHDTEGDFAQGGVFGANNPFAMTQAHGPGSALAISSTVSAPSSPYHGYQQSPGLGALSSSSSSSNNPYASPSNSLVPSGHYGGETSHGVPPSSFSPSSQNYLAIPSTGNNPFGGSAPGGSPYGSSPRSIGSDAGSAMLALPPPHSMSYQASQSSSALTTTTQGFPQNGGTEYGQGMMHPTSSLGSSYDQTYASTSTQANPFSTSNAIPSPGQANTGMLIDVGDGQRSKDPSVQFPEKRNNNPFSSATTNTPLHQLQGGGPSSTYSSSAHDWNRTWS